MKGILIGNDTLRVYADNGEFTDYPIIHPDLEVEVVDSDFQIRNGKIDVSNKTLGITE